MNLKHILIILLVALIPSSAGSWGPMMISGGSAPAAADYKVAKIYIYESDTESDNYKVSVYDASNNLVATSGAITHAGSATWREASWSGPTLTPGATYRIAITSAGNMSIGCTGSWSASKAASGSYASPPTSINPSTDAEQSAGEPLVYLQNSSSVTLIGKSSGAVTDTTLCNANDTKYYTDGYTCVTQ